MNGAKMKVMKRCMDNFESANIRCSHGAAH